MFFKVPIVALAAVASLVSAVQGIGLEIKNPAQGVTFKPGDRMVVDLGYRAGANGVPTRDISVVISLQSCPSSAKFGSTSACSGRGPLGFDDSILYAGPYSPQGTPGSGTTDVSQTFHLQIPRNFTPGPAMLSTAHFLLTEGVTGYSPFFTTTNITFTVSN